MKKKGYVAYVVVWYSWTAVVQTSILYCIISNNYVLYAYIPADILFLYVTRF